MKKLLIFLMILCLLPVIPATAEDSDYTIAYTPLPTADAAQLHNIRLAVDALNECVVEDGAQFSFNQIVGPRTEACGYVTALNGRGSKVIGGGVSQVATTMYLALCDLGTVEFGDLLMYAEKFTAGYVADGNLAVVTDYDSGRDLTFTNRSGSPIQFTLWLSDNYLYCTAESVADDGILFSPIGSAEGFFISAQDPQWQSVLLASASIECADSDPLLNNTRLAADSIYDTTLSAGDSFSFNGSVGPRAEKYGYEPALNGRGVKVVGGGVAQVASVLWLAVKDIDDVSIVEKSTYGSKYNQSYVSSSADAILTDYNAGTDFAFRYDGPGSITIYTTLNGTTLTCEIYRNN